MNKLLITTSLVTLSFFIVAQESNAHTVSTTARGSVQCLDPNGRVVSNSYCTAGNNAGRRPGIPSRTCYTSHTHSSGGGGGISSTGGHDYVDTDGDGITDTAAIDAPPGTYSGGNSLGDGVSPFGETTVSIGGNLLGGKTTHVRGTVKNGNRTSEWDGNANPGGFCCGSDSTVGGWFGGGRKSGSSKSGGSSKSSSKSDCFVTTAVVDAMGEDDCGPTLTKLRFLRDYYTAHNHRGAERIQIYYDVAPSIVQKVNSLKNSKVIWRDIHDTWIKPIRILIEQRNFKQADRLYADMVMELSWKYIAQDLPAEKKKELFLHTFKIHPAIFNA